MSLKQNDQYYENLYENNICFECLQKITLVLRDNGDTQSEWEMEDGHRNDCVYFEVEANDDAKEARIKKYQHDKAFDVNEYVKKANEKAPKKKVQQRMMNNGEIVYENPFK